MLFRGGLLVLCRHVSSFETRTRNIPPRPELGHSSMLVKFAPLSDGLTDLAGLVATHGP